MRGEGPEPAGELVLVAHSAATHTTVQEMGVAAAAGLINYLKTKCARKP